MTDREYLDNLREAVGLPRLGPPDFGSYESLRKTEWSAEFEQLMRNRLILGAIRYGRMHQQGKVSWDRCGSIQRRLDLYCQTGAAEYLADIANLALLQYVEGTHKSFEADPDEHVSPVRKEITC